ncbi:MAG: SH3 domain-containing protein, partial [Clostridiales bacterium]|nr:SH3 domain-containing protein [Clostridiales bacterium]
MKRMVCVLMAMCLLTMSIPALAISRGDLLIVTNCESWVSLRSDASTSAKRLKKLPKGTYVNYVGSSGNGFYRVLHAGTYGYVLREYLETPSYAMRVSNCEEFVSLRAAPKTSAAR